MSYLVWVALGIAAALVARRLQGPQSALDPRQRQAVLLLAIGGAILGAYGLQLPADLLGWSAPIDGAPASALPLGGRTVLGGLIGGWLAVEIGKRAFGIRVPTGDDFALPLALALAFGRAGCLAAGCCAGRACAPGPFAHVDAQGIPRFPVQALEIAFHALAALGFALATPRRALAGRRLALYFAAYAAARFVCEPLRRDPPIWLGLTWHACLAIVLFALCVATPLWTSRARALQHSRTSPS